MVRISAIVSNYNAEAYIADAVASVLACRDPNLEVVVVDDGSTDGSRRVLEEFRAHPDVRLVFQENGGQASAFNAGLAHSTGDVLCFFDGDDFWFPHKAREIRKVFEENGFYGRDVLLRHPLQRIAMSPGLPVREDLRFGTTSLDAGELALLTRDADVRREVAQFGFFGFNAGLSASTVMTRSLAERFFPLPTEASKHHGDYFLVLGANLVGETYGYGSLLGAYRIHGANHSLNRPLNTYHFWEVTERWMNDVLARNGFSERVDFFGSRFGRRWAFEHGRGREALAKAWARARSLRNRRALAELLTTTILGLRYRLGLERPVTRRV